MSTDFYAHPQARDWVAPAPAAAALPFHQSLPGYAPTPLVPVTALADELGVAAVWVKDESARLGLAAFKILGASWAAAQVVAQRTGADATDLRALQRAASASGIMLVTATDGNHGRAVARMAAELGTESVVFVPATMTEEAAQAIAAEGAEVVRTDSDYDRAIAAAARFAAADEERELIQDTAWGGYRQVPAWIVQGYETLLAEIDAELPAAPDLVAVPVGVGSLAQAVAAHYRRATGHRPALLSAEPEGAACLLQSLRAGTLTSVRTGATVMAGLNCGTVSAGAWPVLQAGWDGAVSVSDEQALQAVADLQAAGISSGPSGAASLAATRAALAQPDLRRSLGITPASTVVLLNTEGSARTRA